jgi:hypothetical protein
VEVEVECLPLSAVPEKAGVTRIHGMKLDIEGFEFRVLKRFFEEVAESLYPGFVLVEQKDWWIDQAGGQPGRADPAARLSRGVASQRSQEVAQLRLGARVTA